MQEISMTVDISALLPVTLQVSVSQHVMAEDANNADTSN